MLTGVSVWGQKTGDGSYREESIERGAVSVELSAEEKSELEARIISKVNAFQRYLNRLADRDASPQTRDAAVAAAKDLFMGKCEPYRYVDTQTGVEKMHKEVQMETSSKYRSRKLRQSMKSYLNKLRQISTDKVTIEQADAVRVDNITRNSRTGEYEAIVYFGQRYERKRDGKVVYYDTTDKRMKVYVKAIDAPEPGRVTWQIYLGDVSVVSTH